MSALYMKSVCELLCLLFTVHASVCGSPCSLNPYDEGAIEFLYDFFSRIMLDWPFECFGLLSS
jgi:hypothetical protein